MTSSSTSENKVVNYLDDVLANFSLFGRYHLGIVILLLFLSMNDSMTCVNYIFAVEQVGYRCKDDRFINQTCNSIDNSTDVCTDWIYDDPNSFVAEFQLACQDWKRTLVGTAHNVGYAVGLLVIGVSSDRWGRKFMIIVTGVLGAVFGVAKSYVTWYWVYIALEFLEAGFGDVYSPAFIMMIETVAHEKRAYCQFLCNMGSCIGYIILALMAWLFPYYRHYLRILYGPMILCFFYKYMLDESPRWLLSKGRKAEAIAILEKAAIKNNIKIDKNVLSKITYGDDKKSSLAEQMKYTFASTILLKRFFLCLVWWMTATFVIYGLKINLVLLPGNKYVNYGMLAVVDLPAKSGAAFVLKKYRRKLPLVCAFILTAVMCVIHAFVPINLTGLSIVLFMAGKMLATAFCIIIYLFTSEIFPTYTRNSMHALCSALGRVGSAIAPQTPLLRTYWEGLPSLVFGGASLFAGLVTMSAPDTANIALPDNVRQAEVIDSKNHSIKENKVIVNDCEERNTRL